MAEKSVLGNQVRLGACEIGNSTEHDRMAGRLSEMQKGVFEERNQADELVGERMQESMHVG